MDIQFWCWFLLYEVQLDNHDILRSKINVSDSKLSHLSTDNWRLLYENIVKSATGIRFYWIKELKHCYTWYPRKPPALNWRLWYNSYIVALSMLYCPGKNTGYYELPFLCPRHKMARGHLVFALSFLPSFHCIKVCLLNSSYILAWTWMKLDTDVVPQV